MCLRSALISILNKLGLFNSLRDLYRRVLVDQRCYVDFYRQFLPPGSLCFDIGANIGEKTDIFRKLGAHVVAVEPQSGCFKFLQRKYGRDAGVVLVNAAVTDKPGNVSMRICSANALSTISPQWLEIVSKGRYKDYKWDRVEKIEAITLDDLVSRFGKPVFCKLDVEGAEYAILQGLSVPLHALCFEVCPEVIQNASLCLRRCLSLGSCKVQFSSNAVNFIFPEWLTVESAIAWLDGQTEPVYGDFFVRFD